MNYLASINSIVNVVNSIKKHSSSFTKKKNFGAVNAVVPPTHKRQLVNSSEESDGMQTSDGSKKSHNSITRASHPKITVLEELSFKSSSAPDHHSFNDNIHKGTSTTHNSTTPTVITAVLRDLRDDIVRSPTFGQPTGPVALVNGDSAIAVIGSDNIYVQSRTKFIPVPREKAFSSHHSEKSFWAFQNSRLDEHSPLDVAVLVQKIFTPLSSVCFGLLGGVALLQLIIVHKQVGEATNEDQKFFLQSYSKFADITPLLFYILLAVCIVSVLDRVSVEHRINMWQPSWLVLAIYTLTLILTVSCASYDDMFILYPHNKTWFDNPMRTQEMVSNWQLLNTLRCLSSIIGWVVFSLSAPPDLLLQHLICIKQYKQKMIPVPTTSTTVNLFQ